MQKIFSIFAIISLFSWLCLPVLAQPRKTTKELEIAFARDNYQVVKKVTFQGQRGIMAEHKSATVYETGKRKRVFYVEGNNYQMGYLMALLTHDEIERMSTEFVDNVLFDFMRVDIDPKKIPIIWGILKEILLEGAETILPDIPQKYVEEMKGICDGCKAVNPDTKVDFRSILALNVGFDAVLSHAYALNKVRDSKLDPHDLELPVMCNAFSVFGRATVNQKHYFGRDFMFPTAGVFQDTACMTIYNPTAGDVPMVSVGAPGFVGAIATMNADGVGMGVDMVPGNSCNPKRPGVNSLLMVRHATAQGNSAEEALDTIVQTQRGVSWLYFVADGTNDRAVVVETGQKTAKMDFLKYPADELKQKGLLPDQAFLDRHENQKHQQGLMVRWHDYTYPKEFLNFNMELFEHHDKKHSSKAWGERGYINRYKENNCPQGLYFAPQRENKDDVLIMTNHYVVPSMRISAMHPMTQLVGGSRQDDLQWRYDELNNQILASYGRIDEQKAIELIDYLAPYRDFPDYYAKNKYSSDKQTQRIRGSVSLCNLTDKVIHSKYGYYKDQWISLTLPNYLGE